ncbi:hypothetical protein CCACVL1_01992, partial [Corchorus capsularis]
MVPGWKTRNSAAALVIVTTLLISSCSFLVNAQDVSYPSVAYPSNSWLNVPVFDFSIWDSAGVRPILITGTFVCGFHCRVPKFDNCLFAISIFQANTSDGNNLSSAPKIVWSGNRNQPVRLRASLQLSGNGDLMLQDVDGTPVWNTNTTGKFVSGLKLTEEGNLVLYDGNNETVWQSFDHQTDTLVPGQALFSGQKLTANVSTSNSSSGLYSLTIVNDSLIAFLEPDAQQTYFGPLKVKTYEPGQSKALYSNGSFGPFLLPSTSAPQFIKLEADGYLRAYQLRESKWEQVSDLFINSTGPCDIPSVCGKYGLCSNGSCRCPDAKDKDSVVYLSQVSEDPSLGCSLKRPVSCRPSDHDHSHSLVELKDFDYFNFAPQIKDTDRENCKEACLKECSCKAAIYREQSNSSIG